MGSFEYNQIRAEAVEDVELLSDEKRRDGVNSLDEELEWLESKR